MTPSMTAISLFTGAGGLDLGCERAGFLTLAAVESNTTARATLLANRDRYFRDLGENTIFTDMVGLDVPELLERAGVERGETTLLHGAGERDVDPATHAPDGNALAEAQSPAV